jgi:hypothetical protein
MKHASVLLVVLAGCSLAQSQIEQAATADDAGQNTCVKVQAPITAECAAPTYTGEYAIVQQQYFSASDVYNCQYQPKCVTNGLGKAPLASDATCNASLDQACKGMQTWGGTFWAYQRRPCDQLSDDTKQKLNSYCWPPPSVTASCSICTGQLHADLCPGGDTTNTVDWLSGCGKATTTAGAGYTLLAEFGAADGNSADFQCQWVQNCNVSAPDVSVSYDDKTDTVTTCFPADGGSTTLCDPAALTPAKQTRQILFTRHWDTTMRYYYNDLFYRSITRDEVRNQAKADCDAKSMTPAQCQSMCNAALGALGTQLSMRLMYCCVSPNATADSGVVQPNPE